MHIQKMEHAVLGAIGFVEASIDVGKALDEHGRQPHVAVVQDAEFHLAFLALVDRRETVQRNDDRGLPPGGAGIQQVFDGALERTVDFGDPRQPVGGLEIAVAGNCGDLAHIRNGIGRFRRTVAIVGEA